MHTIAFYLANSLTGDVATSWSDEIGDWLRSITGSLVNYGVLVYLLEPGHVDQSDHFYLLADEAISPEARGEFDHALELFERDESPSLYVYFREPMEADVDGSVTDLMDFIKVKFGEHYWSSFTHPAEIMVNMLKELSLDENLRQELSFKNAYAYLGDSEMLSIAALPLYAGNEQIGKLRAELAEVQDQIDRLDEEAVDEDPVALALRRSPLEKRREELKEQLEDAEQNLLAIFNSEYADGTGMTPRMLEAKRRLEMNDYDGATDVFESAEALQDVLNAVRAGYLTDEETLKCIREGRYWGRINLAKPRTPSNLGKLDEGYRILSDIAVERHVGLDVLLDYADFLVREHRLDAAVEKAEDFLKAQFWPNVKALDRAEAYRRVAYYYRRAKRYDDEIKALREELDIYEQASSLEPGAHDWELAQAMGQLAIALEKVGNMEEPERLLVRSLELYESLAEDSPGVYRRQVVRALVALGIFYRKLEDWERILDFTDRALEIERAEDTHRSPAQERRIAKHLTLRAEALQGLERPEEAIAPLDEALSIIRRLDEANPGMYVADVAEAERTLAASHAALGFGDVAERLYRMSYLTLKALKEGRSRAKRSQFAESATALGNFLKERQTAAAAEEAESLFQEALDVYRELAEEDPTYLGDLSRAASTMGVFLEGSGRGPEAERFYRESRDAAKRSVDEVSERFKPILSRSTGRLARYLEGAGRADEAEPYFKEAYENIACAYEANPARYARQMVAACVSFAAFLENTDRADEALSYQKKIYEIDSGLAEEDPEGHLADLARSATTYALALERQDRLEEADPIYRVALESDRRLVEELGHSEYRAYLAKAIMARAIFLEKTDAASDAEALYVEAVDLYEDLEREDSEAYLPELASAKFTLAVVKRSDGSEAEALALFQEALDSYRELAKEDSESYLPYVARTSRYVADTFHKQQNYEPAETHYLEALDIYRARADAGDVKSLRFVAEICYLLGAQRAFLREPEAARSRFAEANEAYDALLERSDSTIHAEAAVSMKGVADVIAADGCGDESIALYRRALELLRNGSYAASERRLVHIVATLQALRNRFEEAHRFDEMRSVLEEIVEAYQELSRSDEVHLINLVASVHAHVAALRRLNRAEAALDFYRTTLKGLRERGEGEAEGFSSAIAGWLFALGVALRDLGDLASAANAFEEAFRSYQCLAEGDSHAYLLGLFWSSRNLAEALRARGSDDAARELCERGLEECRLHLGGDPAYLRDAAGRAYRLGLEDQIEGSLDDAKHLYLGALDLYDLLFDLGFGEFLVEKARCDHGLSYVLHDLGEDEQAEIHGTRAINAYLALSLERPQFLLHVAQSDIQQAEILKGLSRRPETEGYYRDALNSFSLLPMGDSNAYKVQATWCRQNLGNALRDAAFHGRKDSRDEALRLFHEAIDAYVSIAGDDSIKFLHQIAWCHQHLARTLKEGNRFEEAEPVFLKSVELYGRLYALDPKRYRHEFAWCYQNLASVQRSIGLVDLSRENYLTASELFETLRHESSIDYLEQIAFCNNELAEMLKNTQYQDEVEGYYRAALDANLEIAKRTRKPNDRPVSSCASNLADILMNEDRLLEAEPCFNEALAAYRRREADPNRGRGFSYAYDIAKCVENLLAINFRLGKLGIYVIYLKKEMDDHRALAADDPVRNLPYVANYGERFAYVLRLQGQLDEAADVYAETIRCYRTLIACKARRFWRFTQFEKLNGECYVDLLARSGRSREEAEAALSELEPYEWAVERAAELDAQRAEAASRRAEADADAESAEVDAGAAVVDEADEADESDEAEEVEESEASEEAAAAEIPVVEAVVVRRKPSRAERLQVRMERLRARAAEPEGRGWYKAAHEALRAGDSLMRDGHYGDAKAFFNFAYNLFRTHEAELGDSRVQIMARCHKRFAHVFEHLGDSEHAARYYEQTLGEYRSLLNHLMKGGSKHKSSRLKFLPKIGKESLAYARMLMEGGETERSGELLDEAYEIAKECYGNRATEKTRRMVCDYARALEESLAARGLDERLEELRRELAEYEAI